MCVSDVVLPLRSPTENTIVGIVAKFSTTNARLNPYPYLTSV